MRATYNIKIDDRWYMAGEEIPEKKAKAPAGEAKPTEVFVTVTAETAAETATAETEEKPKTAKSRSTRSKKTNA